MIKKKPSLYEMILMNNHSKEKINIFKTIEVCYKIILPITYFSIACVEINYEGYKGLKSKAKG